MTLKNKIKSIFCEHNYIKYDTEGNIPHTDKEGNKFISNTKSYYCVKCKKDMYITTRNKIELKQNYNKEY